MARDKKFDWDSVVVFVVVWFLGIPALAQLATENWGVKPDVKSCPHLARSTVLDQPALASRPGVRWARSCRALQLLHQEWVLSPIHGLGLRPWGDGRSPLKKRCGYSLARF
jgi:hypothetical protein